MHALDVLGDPARRRILELLAAGERSAGDIVGVLAEERGMSQPAVSQQLRVLRERGFVRVRVDRQRRVYAVEPAPLQAVDAWLDRFRRFWEGRLDALGAEIARGKRQRRRQRS
jgi:DNA-binding transcriptional ArsR family regulator